MAERKAKHVFKRSNVAGKKPIAGDLLLGEVALNTADVIMWTSGTTQSEILPIGWDRVSKTGDTMTGTLYAPSVSATTFYGGTYYGDGSNLTGIIDRQILDIYESGTTSTTGAYTDVVWDATIINDTDYGHSSAEITFSATGYYEVSYSISCEGTVGGRKTGRHRLLLDNGGGYNEIPRSGMYSYHRNTAQPEGYASKTIRQQFTAGDKIKAQISISTGGGTLVTIAGDSNITINKIPSE